MEDRHACLWPNTDMWLFVDEIAAYLGIKRDTVYKWIAEKQLPGHHMGSLWKFHTKEVDEWVTSGGTVVKGKSRKSDDKNIRPILET